MIEDIWENPKKYFDFQPLKVGRWWNNKEEIDIVAYDDKNIAFIECKWQENIKIDSVKNRLIEKSTNISHNKKAFYFVITKNSYLQ